MHLAVATLNYTTLPRIDHCNFEAPQYLSYPVPDLARFPGELRNKTMV